MNFRELLSTLKGNNSCKTYNFRIKVGNVQIVYCSNCVGGIMVSVLVSNVVDREFETRSGQTKDYKINICCFSAKNVALRRKSKDWLARN